MFGLKDKEKEVSITMKDVCERLANVESKLKGLEIENNDLRNKVLRRIQDRTPVEEEDKPLKPKHLTTLNPFAM